MLSSRSSVHWGLHAGNDPLPPRSFSNGKTQASVVQEIVDAFRAGASDVFFHANLGSGKSIVALHVIANMGRGMVVVPTKNLQDQYAEDYEGKLLITHPRSGLPMTIRVMKGRASFHCAHHDTSADSPDLVCTRELSPNVPRWMAASQCPDWSPLYPTEIVENIQNKVFLGDEAAEIVEFQNELEDAMSYPGIFGDYSFVPRGQVCPYFAQSHAFLSADATILNQAKWTAETVLGRKPRLDVEIFDECDGLLDTLVDTVEITLPQIDHLLRMLQQTARLLKESNRRPGKRHQRMVAALQLARKELNDTKPGEEEQVPVPVDLLDALVKLYGDMDNESAGRYASQYKGVLEYADASLCVRSHGKYALTVGDPRAVLAHLLSKSGKQRLWMSATLQDPAILREVYGFRNPVVVEGETAYQGKLKVCVPRKERVAEVGPVPMSYQKWHGVTGKPGEAEALRAQFARCLAWIRKGAKGPTAYLVHGKGYLESIKEESKDARHVLKLLEKEREDDAQLARFIRGEVREIASTRMNRGVDLKGELCRDIVLIKFPIPDVSDPRFQAISKKFREKYGEQKGTGLFWKYARDCARRTLLQQIGRGMRSPEDWVRVWTTDSKVLEWLTEQFPDDGVVEVVEFD